MGKEMDLKPPSRSCGAAATLPPHLALQWLQLRRCAARASVRSLPKSLGGTTLAPRPAAAGCCRLPRLPMLARARVFCHLRVQRGGDGASSVIEAAYADVGEPPGPAHQHKRVRPAAAAAAAAAAAVRAASSAIPVAAVIIVIA